MRCASEWLRLYAVTDRAWVGERSLTAQIEEALIGGATCVQLREKALSDAEFLAEAIAVKALCKRYGVPLWINDNVEVALSCGADGVHVGQHDMAAGKVRERIGNRMLLGVSAQTVAQAVEAERNGADCLGVGAVFPTTTKADAQAVTTQTLREIYGAVSIPVVAIGGITKENLSSLAGTGIAGVALVSAIFASADITGACRDLRARVAEITTGNV